MIGKLSIDKCRLVEKLRTGKWTKFSFKLGWHFSHAFLTKSVNLIKDTHDNHLI
jgi:hypothetical protein